MSPRTFDELLAACPGLRRRRSITADWLRILMDRQPGECTWCGQPVGRGRQTWCGEQCVNDFRSRCDSEYVRRLVIKRDGGICQVCSRDTVLAEKSWQSSKSRQSIWRQAGETEQDFGKRKKQQEIDLLAAGFARGCWREVDHIIPCIEYGGLCEPSGMRLLCGACHLGATQVLAARRKRKITRESKRKKR